MASASPLQLPEFRLVSRSSKGQWQNALREQELLNWEILRVAGAAKRAHLSDRATYVQTDALSWLRLLPAQCIHAVVTDPPYGIEYGEKDHNKMREGRGGVWRIPPRLDGVTRQPVPRFTVLSKSEIFALQEFFSLVASELRRVLVPGGHVFIAANPLISSHTFLSFIEAGFEKRGEVIRLVQTLRGGDRPKGAEEEFAGVSVMPRSCWEPWGIFRKPIVGTVAENLRMWGTGGLRRISETEPFKDVIRCSPARGREKEIAPHPSLKPQKFVRRIAKASLPFGIGIIYDPFAGSGSTLAAAHATNCHAIGTDCDAEYFKMASRAFPALSVLPLADADLT